MYRNAPVLGLSGQMQSGKDTFAKFLVEHHGWMRVAYADALKRVALELDPVVGTTSTELRLRYAVEQLGWDAAKTLVPEVRRTLQALGVAVRSVAPNFWIDLVAEQVHGARAAGIPVVITDVRFPNEAEDVVRMGGKILRIERPGALGDNHPSETVLRGWLARNEHQVLTNDSTLSDLAKKAEFVHRFLTNNQDRSNA
jgi:hypothetical protein